MVRNTLLFYKPTLTDLNLRPYSRRIGSRIDSSYFRVPSPRLHRSDSSARREIVRPALFSKSSGTQGEHQGEPRTEEVGLHGQELGPGIKTRAHQGQKDTLGVLSETQGVETERSDLRGTTRNRRRQKYSVLLNLLKISTQLTFSKQHSSRYVCIQMVQDIHRWFAHLILWQILCGECGCKVRSARNVGGRRVDIGVSEDGLDVTDRTRKT